jgi:hypothetical protein
MKRILISVVTVTALVVGGLFTGTAQAHGPGHCGPGGSYRNRVAYYPTARIYPTYPRIQVGYFPTPQAQYFAPIVPYGGYPIGSGISYSQPGFSFYFGR